MDAKEARRRDRFEQLGAAAAKDAIANSGLEITDANAGRIGVLVSSAIGGIKSLSDAVITNFTEGPRRVESVFDSHVDAEWCGWDDRD